VHALCEMEGLFPGGAPDLSIKMLFYNIITYNKESSANQSTKYLISNIEYVLVPRYHIVPRINIVLIYDLSSTGTYTISLIIISFF
jgi:hypothetical protein